MRIAIIVDPGQTRAWHRALHGRLADRRGASVVIGTAAASAEPPSTRLLFALEKLVYRLGDGHAADTDDLADLPRQDDGGTAADLVIDLAGQGGPPDVPRLTLSCCGSPVDLGALEAVLAGDVPILALDLHRGDEIRRLSRWRLAVETPDVALTALDAIFDRAVAILDFAVLRLMRGLSPVFADSLNGHRLAAPRDSAAPARFIAAGLRRHVQAALDRHLKRVVRHQVGWRALVMDPSGLPRFPAARFHRLRTGRGRNHGAPFLLSRDGRTFLFVDEFPLATGKGLISVAEMRDGGFGAPRPVLETETHMSHPFVFEHEGTVWMVPDTASRRTLEFWVAVEFPDRWERRYLIRGVDLSHPTVVVENGRLYLMATARYSQIGSQRDALVVLTAERIAGPWQPVGAPGPVLVDAASARPAGRILKIEDALVRPAEDNRGRAGAGLAFAEIVTLSPEAYMQKTVAAFRPAPPHLGVDHYERDDRFELVAVSGPGRGAIDLRPDAADL